MFKHQYWRVRMLAHGGEAVREEAGGAVESATALLLFLLAHHQVFADKNERTPANTGALR
jgi:hypothetical protein